MAENSGISHEYESYELEMAFRGLLLPDEELIWCASPHKNIDLFVLSLIKQIETAEKSRSSRDRDRRSAVQTNDRRYVI